MTDPARWLAKVRELESRGELLLAYDVATQALEEHPDDLWLEHRAVLNLAKAGATARAEAEFTRLGLDRTSEPDVAALGARIAKDKALAAPPARHAPLLARAADLYGAIFERTGDYYPAINVATLRLLAGQRQEAERMARSVLAICARAAGHDQDAYYRAASEAEAALVLGDSALARAALARAATQGRDLAARAATRRQLPLVCEARSLSLDALAPLAPPPVAHYTGHMISPPWQSGRFPAEQETGVAKKIVDALARHDVGFGYGALASGADILFAEALLARGAELHVVLPFALQEFEAVSVAPAGGTWTARFRACLDGARSVTFATEDRYLGHDWLFAYGSLVAMGLAVLRARFLDGEVRQFAVWDGVETGGVAGTGFDVRFWRERGRAAEIIACGAGARGPAASPAGAGGEQRELRGMSVRRREGLQQAHRGGFPRSSSMCSARSARSWRISVTRSSTATPGATACSSS